MGFGSFFKKIFKVVRKIAPILAFAIPVVGPALGMSATAISAISGASKIFSAINTVKGLSGNDNKMQARAQAAPNLTKEAPLTRPSVVGVPSSLSSLAGYAPEQERSAIASKGLNQGLGSDEDAYYRNLLQRQLIGDGNKVNENPNSLLPVESQYFSRQGVDTSSIQNFLKQIRR